MRYKLPEIQEHVFEFETPQGEVLSLKLKRKNLEEVSQELSYKNDLDDKLVRSEINHIQYFLEIIKLICDNVTEETEEKLSKLRYEYLSTITETIKDARAKIPEEIKKNLRVIS